jgi:hypothetical protein
MTTREQKIEAKQYGFGTRFSWMQKEMEKKFFFKL